METENEDLFDINGKHKLDQSMVDFREQIINHYAKSPKAVFYVSHSGGADSSAAYEYVKRIVPMDRIVVVHAYLGDEVEHTGNIEHIKNNIEHKLHIVQGVRDFIDMVLTRGKFPSAQFRQCTSDLKTSPICAFIRKHMKENGYTVGFNITGIRAYESNQRAKKNPLYLSKLIKPLKNGKRVVYDWMPVFHLTQKQVFDVIKSAGKKRHPMYDKGNDRLSCLFCILGSKCDLKNGAKERPEEYHLMVALERVINHTMFSKRIKGEVIPVSLSERVEDPIDEAKIQHYMTILKKRQITAIADKRALAESRKAKSKQNKHHPKISKRDEGTIDMFSIAS